MLHLLFQFKLILIENILWVVVLPLYLILLSHIILIWMEYFFFLFFRMYVQNKRMGYETNLFPLLRPWNHTVYWCRVRNFSRKFSCFLPAHTQVGFMTAPQGRLLAYRWSYIGQLRLYIFSFLFFFYFIMWYPDVASTNDWIYFLFLLVEVATVNMPW